VQSAAGREPDQLDDRRAARRRHRDPDQSAEAPRRQSAIDARIAPDPRSPRRDLERSIGRVVDDLGPGRGLRATGDAQLSALPTRGACPLSLLDRLRVALPDSLRGLAARDRLAVPGLSHDTNADRYRPL